MMRHVYMASPYVSSSTHTGAPSSKAFTRMDVMQKQFLQVCCSHSVHRVSSHDATCLYGIVVCVVQHPHSGTQFKSIGSNRCHAKTILAIVILQRPQGFSNLVDPNRCHAKAFLAICAVLQRPQDFSYLQLKHGHLFLCALFTCHGSIA